MNFQENFGKETNSGDADKVVVVAVKASKEIPKDALVWALNHVVQPGDCIKLLVVIPANTSGTELLTPKSSNFHARNFSSNSLSCYLLSDDYELLLRLWQISRFTADCTSGHNWSHSGTTSDQKDDIRELCSQMMLQLNYFYDPSKIRLKIKIVSGSPGGVVAAEAKKAQTNWVILDKNLKHEGRRCIEDLQCNVVAIKKSQPKFLHLNLVGLPKTESVASFLPYEFEASADYSAKNFDMFNEIPVPAVTPASSPEQGTPFSVTDIGPSSASSSDPGTTPFFSSEIIEETKKLECFNAMEIKDVDESDSDTDSEKLSSPSISPWLQTWKVNSRNSCGDFSKPMSDNLQRAMCKPPISTAKALHEKFCKLDREAKTGKLNNRLDLLVSKKLQESIGLSRNIPSGPPPLCSICQHKAPVFGKPPTSFTYGELEIATGGFSKSNFLAEGGYGSVHRGVLPDGLVVAVKQHKLASSQGDREFCSEVEVLSCAQHRNVVMLIGFCVEDKRRLLVYEYICNGSLDSHLYGRRQNPLKWSSRQKIAVGAARGLRYLHEECRVGCIVHRDMRPNNILVTHDFEPLVGDFGLARWQPDGDTGVETRVLGTFGYLAPEYAQSGQITEKADVYSFGVVLLELVTGRKAIDINRPKGQQCLTEWARPLIEDHAIDELVDPRLENCYSEQEIHCMLSCAFLCIQRDPHSRPRMSQVWGFEMLFLCKT
ncbi:LOW QUALITY PROTEIN: Serine-threonine/tyrosine-protein kinase, catalytic domain [Dillenia turbinata]|uniref:Serine-threonine/tyrosine-protein kinase, catalytic domain n=1 Tax=Dillenia turbinata TaxID=194707 RepID=A0AAN8ZKI7_9MAGN